MNEYEQQAIDFCKRHGVTITPKYRGCFPRLWEHATGQWEITITRDKRQPWILMYSQSIMKSWVHRDEHRDFKWKQGLPPKYTMSSWPKTGDERSLGHYAIQPTRIPPTAYDILACLTKYNPGSHRNFCFECGYDEDSRKSLELYLAVQEEYFHVEGMFADCMEELQDIC